MPKRVLLCRRTWLAAVLLSLGSLATQAGCRLIKSGELDLQNARHHPVIAGSINQQAVSWLADTGAAETGLSKEMADKLQLTLQLLPGVTTLGIGGESRLYSARAENVVIGPIASKSFRFTVAEAMSGPGLLGADLLFQFDLEFDAAAGKLRFFTPDGCKQAHLAYWDNAASSISTRMGESSDRRQLITVHLNGKPVEALIDTGAMKTVVDRQKLAKLGLTGVRKVESDQERHAVGVGKHKVKLEQVEFESVMIGDEVLPKARVLLADIYKNQLKDINTIGMSDHIDEQPAVILGMDFLGEHRVLFALSQNRFYFTHLGGKVFGVQPLWAVQDGAAQH